MRMEAWNMSARLAWHRPWFRALTVGLAACVLTISAIFLWKIQPMIHESDIVVFHTNIYFGVDDVRDWQWMFVWPLAWVLMAIASILAALGMYQRDALLAYSLLAWLLVWSCPWAISLYYLTLFSPR